MPAESQAQQKLMGMALAYKRGKMPGASKKIKEVAEGMSEKQLKDFAKTKHEGLPEKKAFILGFVKRAAEHGFDESQAVELLKTAESSGADQTLGNTIYGGIGRALTDLEDSFADYAGKGVENMIGGASPVYNTIKPVLRGIDKAYSGISGNAAVNKGVGYLNKGLGYVDDGLKFFENNANKLNPVAQTVSNTATKVIDPVVNKISNSPVPSQMAIKSTPLQKELGQNVVNTFAYPIIRETANALIPGAGGIVSAAHAAERAARGDRLGAWIDRGSALSNAASVFPAAYPVAKPLSVGLNGVNLARDFYNGVKPVVDVAKPYFLQDIRSTLPQPKISQPLQTFKISPPTGE